jgi:hypothetical protein
MHYGNKFSEKENDENGSVFVQGWTVTLVFPDSFGATKFVVN